MAYNAVREFKKELRNNGCCCCNAYCWAVFLLCLALLWDVLMIVIFSIAVAAVPDAYGVFIVSCYEDGVAVDDCDLKKLLRDAGYDEGVASFMLVLQIIASLVSLLGIIGLCNWYCI